jgi:DNA primase
LADDRDDLKRRVKEANDIVDVVGTYIALRPAGPTYKGLCPFHEDHRPSFDVDPRRQRYRCWACGKVGDVFTFIQEHDKVGFREALELLARRASISLEKTHLARPDSGRSVMLEQVAWAAGEFHRCLLDSPLGESARRYVGERGLNGETVRRFGLGFAPGDGSWLIARAQKAGRPLEMLEKLGLIARRNEGGFYDRFRDRVMFPIRDGRGQAVGFGGRILPSSPLTSPRIPKYYNSAESPLFKKSVQLYGIDQARQAGAAAGYLAVVEGYTDVLMAHQLGIPQVVSTMGTALNRDHVRHLRRFVPKVILVFDADAGGDNGVDRALEIFVSQEVDLAVATLPAGLDPCDLLVRDGPDAFRRVLAEAVDALDFKLSRVLAKESSAGVEGKRRAADALLGIIALAPDMPGQALALKQQLVISRIAQRLAVREETLWARLRELRAKRRPALPAGDDAPERKAKAAPMESQLLQMLLADPKLVGLASAHVTSEEIEHPGLRQLLQALYDLHANGEVPDLDALRANIDSPALAQAALKLQEVGRATFDRPSRLSELLAEFHKRRQLPETQELQNRLHAAHDHTEGVELLKRLQQRTVGLEPGT